MAERRGRPGLAPPVRQAPVCVYRTGSTPGAADGLLLLLPHSQGYGTVQVEARNGVLQATSAAIYRHANAAESRLAAAVRAESDRTSGAHVADLLHDLGFDGYAEFSNAAILTECAARRHRPPHWPTGPTSERRTLHACADLVRTLLQLSGELAGLSPRADRLARQVSDLVRLSRPLIARVEAVRAGLDLHHPNTHFRLRLLNALGHQFRRIHDLATATSAGAETLAATLRTIVLHGCRAALVAEGGANHCAQRPTTRLAPSAPMVIVLQSITRLIGECERALDVLQDQVLEVRLSLHDLATELHGSAHQLTRTMVTLYGPSHCDHPALSMPHVADVLASAGATVHDLLLTAAEIGDQTAEVKAGLLRESELRVIDLIQACGLCATLCQGTHQRCHQVLPLFCPVTTVDLRQLPTARGELEGGRRRLSRVLPPGSAGSGWD